MRFPYSVALQGETLAVADTANNRILFWHSLPRHGAGIPADEVIGQVDFQGNGENRWKAVLPDTLCWPYGLALFQQTLVVADSGNNRVTLWKIEDASSPTEKEEVLVSSGAGEI